MHNLVCLRHPDYNGSNPPVLSCKPCCSIYIEFIKSSQASQTQFDAQDWIESKKKNNKPNAKAGSDKP